MLNVGDYVGQINKDSSGVWKLYKDKINKITTTKKYGRRYFTKTVFRPLDADDVDNNTKDMEESIGKGYIIVREVFGLNDKTEPYAERWIKWNFIFAIKNFLSSFTYRANIFYIFSCGISRFYRINLFLGNLLVFSLE